MGCSSVVSDIVKGFFLSEAFPSRSRWSTTTRPTGSSTLVLADDDTLTIIVCYSGWSVEPCLFYENMRQLTGNRNLIVLSGGGKIANLCREHGSSLIQYKLRHADRSTRSTTCSSSSRSSSTCSTS